MSQPTSTFRTEKTTATTTAELTLLTLTGRRAGERQDGHGEHREVQEDVHAESLLENRRGRRQAAISATSCVKRARAAAMRSRFSPSSKV